MKKQLLLPIMALLVITSCKKKETPDTTAPVITLNGNAKDTISLNSNYSDPGAFASDDVDGNISGSIITSGNVNTNAVGEYRRFYNVMDDAGNTAAQITRFVFVRNDADYLVGTYNAIANCGATQTSSFVTTLNTSGTVNNQVVVSMGNQVSGAVATIDVNGNLMTIPLSNGGGFQYYGTGTIAANKKQFTLNYFVSSQAVSWSCSTSYFKQ